MRRILLSIVFAVAAAALVVAQPPAAPPQSPADAQPPITFRVDVNYVEIDAVVVDAAGRPLVDLTRADFQVLEDGVPQKIDAFSVVNLPLVRQDPPLQAASPIEPDVRSNRREFDGRIYLLILDDLNTHFARSAEVRAAAREFIERHFGANDVAAVVHTGGSRTGTQEFTSSRGRLLRAVDAFMGQKARSATLEKLDDYNRNRLMGGLAGPPRDLSEAERAHKARRTLSSLTSAADYLAGVRGRRKAVLFFSEGIDYDTTNAIENRYSSEILEDTTAAIAAATRANVSFYAIDPRGLGGLAVESMEAGAFPIDNTIPPGALQQELLVAQNSLRTLAAETGGFAAVNRNDFSTTFARIVAEHSSYYMLGYSSSDARRDGRFRRVEVRVNRPGARVRSRNGYTAPRGRAAAATPMTREASAELRAAIDSPVPIAGLGITSFAGALKAGGNRASIVMALEIDAARLKFVEREGVFAADLEIVALAVDDRGEVRDGGRDVLNLRLRPQTHAFVIENGVRVLRRLDVPAGRYQLRIGVRENAGGAVGSVLHDLDVPDFSRAPLSMSHVLVTSAAASRTPTANPDPQFKDVMPAPPAARREFPRDDELTVFAEVYDSLVKTPHRVEIAARVVADNGSIVFQRADERRSEELKGKAGGYGYSATVPLSGLAPGRYVLRVDARALLADGASASRELEFRIR